MSDRSTRSSTRSKEGTGQSNGQHTRGRADEQLGDLEFSDWYESQVFEPSSEERFEAMATSGRAPARLIARVVIAAGAKRDRNRGSRDGPADLLEEKGEPVNRSAEDLTAEFVEAETEPAEPSVEETDEYYDGEEEEPEALADETDDYYDDDDDDDEEVGPEAPADEIDDYDGEEDEEDPEALEEETDVYDDEDDEDYDDEDDEDYEDDEEPEADDPEPVVIEPVVIEPVAIEPVLSEPIVIEPVVIEPGAPEPLLIPELAERMSFRQKASALLDRWAEKEVAIATKLDNALVPSISWGSRKKPAHSRRNKSS